MESELNDDDLIKLMERVQKKKIEELFEEPSSYEDELEDYL